MASLKKLETMVNGMNFGYKTFVHILDEKRRKLESKSIPCVFLGYCEGSKAYCLMCVETKRIIKS